MPNQQLEEILKTHPFFSGFTEAQVAVVAGCAELTVFHVDDTIIEEHEDANFLYLIRDGRVSIELHLPIEGHVTLQTLWVQHQQGSMLHPAAKKVKGRPVEEIQSFQAGPHHLHRICQS